MVEEKPTTKVYRNQSSIFGNDEPTKPLAEKKTTAPTYSAPYTTTEPTKTSVKVHYAPGGQSSISFGDSTTTTAPVKKENLKPQDQFNFGPMRKFLISWSSLFTIILFSWYQDISQSPQPSRRKVFILSVLEHIRLLFIIVIIVIITMSIVDVSMWMQYNYWSLVLFLSFRGLCYLYTLSNLWCDNVANV